MSLSPMWNFCHLKDAGAYVQGCVDGRRSTVCLPPGRVALCLSIPHNTTRAPGQASLQANRGHRHHSNSQPSHSREAHHHPLETSTSNIQHALYAPTCPYTYVPVCPCNPSIHLSPGVYPRIVLLFFVGTNSPTGQRIMAQRLKCSYGRAYLGSPVCTL